MSQNGGRFNGQAQIMGGGVKINHISRERAVLIAGPTASGKSALAMDIAARDGRIIVNADALQVYDAWRILSARPSIAEEAALPHALFGHIGRNDPYSTGHWLRDVGTLLGVSEKPVVIVGGTGLNFTALTQGLADIPQIPPDIRARANEILTQRGLAALLSDIDAATRARIDTHNPARVQRAWEVLIATGRGLADWQDSTGPALMPQSACEALVLHMDTPRLDMRIAQRFDTMMRSGALEDARAALPYWPAPRDLSAHMPPWTRAIGAPELVAHLQGHIDLQTAIDRAVLASRQYAKRQRTWFRSKMGAWQVIYL